MSMSVFDSFIARRTGMEKIAATPPWRNAEIMDASIKAQRVEKNPSEKQKESGNYRKAHVRFHGMDISIENPKGYIRRGVSKDGTEWSNKLVHHYGYIKGTEGRDKDHVDCFIGPKPTSIKVFIVNQCNPGTKKFDEHKVMFGFTNEEEAKKGYLANYDKGWKGLASIHETNMDEFKLWLQVGDTKKEYKPSWRSSHTDSSSRDIEKAAAFISGYREVLEKYAAVEVGEQTYTEIPVSSNASDFQSRLLPGDILLFKPSNQVGTSGSVAQNFIAGKGLWGDIKKMFNQGSDWGHAGIYTGDGKIIHTYPKFQKGKVVHDPRYSKVRYHSVAAMMNNDKRDILVLRPSVSEAERQQAVERARTLVGMPFSIRDMVLSALAPGFVRGDLSENDGAICSAVVSYAYPSIRFRGDYSDRVVRPSDLHHNDNVREIEAYSMDAKTASEYSRGYVDLCDEFMKLAWQFSEGAEDLLKGGRTPEEWAAFQKSFENPAVRQRFNKRYAGSQNSQGRIFEKVLLEDNEAPKSSFRGGGGWRPGDHSDRYARSKGYSSWSDYVNSKEYRRGRTIDKMKGFGALALGFGLPLGMLAILNAVENKMREKARQQRRQQAMQRASQVAKAASLSFVLGYNEIMERMKG
jgi:hypothetical protein